MPLDVTHARQCLSHFDFKTLFIEQLGWDSHTASLDVTIDSRTFALNAVAHKRGMVAFLCRSSGQADIPEYALRRKIDRQVAKSVQEHLIIYTDAVQTTQIWQWVKHETGKPTACREHTHHRAQPGDALIQKLQVIAVTLEEEERLSLIDVTSRARSAFDVERITKRFYDIFQKEHAAFLKFLKGIPDEDLQRWYVSVMLNRLMFVYFIQKKHFLDANPDYLRSKLAASQARGKDRFYREFLCPLFFEGFAKKDSERSAATNRLLGKVPYLNGGLFLRHQIEEQCGKDIQIADGAFAKLFAFFEQYHWHLDERPLCADNEINPDVLGYIFEKYVNQKQMGAYYTKEDITGYISQNTVIPFVLDAARRKCKIAFEGDPCVWRLLQLEPDRYLYEPVKRGVIDEKGEVIPESALPEFVQCGMHDPKARMFDKRYNLGEADFRDTAGTKLTLPTETWRVYVERRKRCLELRQRLANGEIRSINDLITYNLNIRQFAQDVIETCEGPDLLRAFWHAIEQVTVLDPTCGSGAFLFAALNILEPLYEACLDRMEVFLEDLALSSQKHRPEKFSDFRKSLDRVAQHPNRRYFILKSVIVNNLYGVDIMEEAVEICKLRLFLKLVAQIDRVEDIEPLPDIDFNIRAGNTLVGYATYEQVKHAVSSKLDFDNVMARIEEKAQDVDRLFALFRQMQTEHGMAAQDFAEAKRELKTRLSKLEDELNRYLAAEYQVNPGEETAYRKWLASHKPFHWFIEFYGIMKKGGFDVAIGNPPYVVYTPAKVPYVINPQCFRTFETKNLYAYVFERSLDLAKQSGCVSLIVQLTVLSAERLNSLQKILIERGLLCTVPFPRRPESIFDGVEMPVAILISLPFGHAALYSCRISRFYTEERDHALPTLRLVQHQVQRNGHRIAKIGTPVEKTIYGKLSRGHIILDAMTRHESKWLLYYQEACRYWVKASVGLPFFKRNGKRIDPPHGRTICFTSGTATALAACLLNSSLFYWFYSAFSDCEHINDALVRGFPIPDGWATSDWLTHYGELQKDLVKNASRKAIRTKQGHIIEYDEIKALSSKPIIDQIDSRLAQHYGFTDDELDFIINYDIKYRMGHDAEAVNGQ
jgi:hypothetical protein